MFENFVSLGPDCRISASMSKYGLRSFSGPFDWLVTTHLKWVLHFVENNFEDFMERENLERLEDDFGAFRDKKAGFLFLHEREYLFEDQWDELRQKYKRRIKRFLNETTKPTCYLRWIVNLEEVEYIKNNYDYINGVIKKKNNKSEIVFLLRNDLKISEPISFRTYIMPELNLGIARESLRGFFNNANEFLAYCASNYSTELLMENLIFDRKQEDEIQKQRAISAQRYYLLANLLENRLDFSLLPHSIIIYGAGNVGRLFYDKVKNKCHIVCFVDKEKAGQENDGISVKKLDEIEFDGDETFIITPTYDYEDICKNILMQRTGNNKVKIVSLAKLFVK